MLVFYSWVNDCFYALLHVIHLYTIKELHCLHYILFTETVHFYALTVMPAKQKNNPYIILSSNLLFVAISLDTETIWSSLTMKFLIGCEMVLGYFISMKILGMILV